MGLSDDLPDDLREHPASKTRRHEIDARHRHRERGEHEQHERHHEQQQRERNHGESPYFEGLRASGVDNVRSINQYVIAPLKIVQSSSPHMSGASTAAVTCCDEASHMSTALNPV